MTSNIVFSSKRALYKYVCIVFMYFAFSCFRVYAQAPLFRSEKASAFFPQWKALDSQNIDWGYLTVPENWEKDNGKTVRLAITRLHSLSKNINQAPVLFIQGGPGGSTISGLWRWLNHPLRNGRDIVLVDLRGTGFSMPALCPDLGKQFMQVLAANDTPNQDIDSRIQLALACKEDLVRRGIDVTAYNSKSISRDLNAVKVALGYREWNVYGVSYGTRIALTYLNEYPSDIKSLVLDSSIPPEAEYYNKNTSNYLRALSVLFDKCKKDSLANRTYPDLENVYYNTIRDLEKNPLEISVPRNIVPSGKFTLNAEDMMLAVQQSLYDRQLLEILPLMIYEFHKNNKDMLAALVTALARRLSLDYGTYYCVLCEETIPFNSLNEFEKDAAKYKGLPDGLAFYKAEFSICKKWNAPPQSPPPAPARISSDKPALILSGEFDPITPPSNASLTAIALPNSYIVEVPSAGHAPSFSECGNEMIRAFLDHPSSKPDPNCFTRQGNMAFVTGIRINGGVTNVTNSLIKPEIPVLIPFIAGNLLLVASIFIFLFYFLRNWKGRERPINMVRILLFTSALLECLFVTGLVFAIKNTAALNPYILAFGLPQKNNYLFIVLYSLSGLTFFALLLFLAGFKRDSNRKWHGAIICSLIVTISYFLYWGLAG